MKEIKYQFKENKIKVNGHVFDVHCGDAEIVTHVEDLRERLEAARASYDPKEKGGQEKILGVIHEIMQYTDVVLGEGAMRKISGGKPVNLVDAVFVLSLIAEGVAQASAEKIMEGYALETDAKEVKK
jgi:hypothetical protein